MSLEQLPRKLRTVLPTSAPRAAKGTKSPEPSHGIARRFCSSSPTGSSGRCGALRSSVASGPAPSGGFTRVRYRAWAKSAAGSSRNEPRATNAAQNLVRWLLGGRDWQRQSSVTRNLPTTCSPHVSEQFSNSCSGSQDSAPDRPTSADFGQFEDDLGQN